MPCVFQLFSFSISKFIDFWPNFFEDQIWSFPICPKYAMRWSTGFQFSLSENKVSFLDPFRSDMQVRSNCYILPKSFLLISAISLCSSIISNLGLKPRLFPSLSNTCTQIDACMTSIGIMASVPNTREKGFSPVALLRVVR